jgi:hypothetical protein
MSDGFSSTFANALLNTLNNTAPTAYSTVYIQIHTGAPGTAGSSNISAGSSTRQSASFGAASNSSNTSTVSITGTPQWTNGGTTETITDLSVWSAVTGGTFLFSVQLAVAVPWANGNTTQLAALNVSFPSAF